MAQKAAKLKFQIKLPTLLTKSRPSSAKQPVFQKRSGGRVRLVRKARIAHEPFCCVFRGKISGSGSGSVIKGVFTKSVADYFIVLLITALLSYIRHEVILRGSSQYTINFLIAFWLVAAVMLLYNTKRARGKYIEMLNRIAAD